MRITEFDIEKGIYSFEFDELNTEIHAHPAVEVIVAIEGSFDIMVNDQTTSGLDFAVIAANRKHQVLSQNCAIKVLMLESNNSTLINLLEKLQIKLLNGVFLEQDLPKKNQLFQELKKFAKMNKLKTPLDKRVEQCISIIESEVTEYALLLPSLRSQIHLSESRLSHLFKEHIGVSLKKYFVWDRLRKAIQYHLTGNENLTEASFQSGFFDQAHLSKAFKNNLGVSPSKAYNSRTLQFSEEVKN